MSRGRLPSRCEGLTLARTSLSSFAVMPIFEYYSPDSNRIYSFFSRGPVSSGKVPCCPDNPNFRMQKVMSGFAVIGRAREPSEEAAADPDDPRMEAAMAELEREMCGMDEDNPDPRQMGRLMRRMAELTGEKLPDSMEEMVRRLEAGEDPESLEEEFGDMAELDGFGEEGGEGAGGPDAGDSTRRRLLRRFRGPSRDPELYELRDYL